MTHPNIPGSLFAAFETNLADAVEPVVGDEARVLRKIDANARRFFVKFDRLEFDSNFSGAAARLRALGRAAPGMVTATVRLAHGAREEPATATEISPSRPKREADFARGASAAPAARPP